MKTKIWLLALGIWVLALVMLAWLPPVQAVNEDELLDPEEAFALTITARDANTVVAEWAIAEGYYMYRERFGFESITSGIRVGEPRLPPGKVKEDEFLGRTEVYRNKVTVEVPLLRDADAAEQLQLEITSQGCADVGVCYMPQTQTVVVDLPPPSKTDLTIAPAASPDQTNALITADSAAGGFVSEQDMIAQMLVTQRFWALPAFFGFGLLLAFTPCVFPMVPILSSIIVGQGENLSQRRAFLLSSVYVLAMAVTYTLRRHSSVGSCNSRKS